MPVVMPAEAGMHDAFLFVIVAFCVFPSITLKIFALFDIIATFFSSGTQKPLPFFYL